MTLTMAFDLDLEKFAQGQNFGNINGENLPKYARILCTGQNLLLASKVKVEQKVKFT